MKYFNLTVFVQLRNLVSLILVLMAHSFNLNAQTSCSLACNGSTQVSVDVNCEAAVSADMILNDQGTSCSNGEFKVVLSNQYGTIPNPIVDPSYIGQNLYAKVIDTLSGNSCWGAIILEDKLGPLIDYCPNTGPIDIKCSDLSILEGPVYIDACEGLSTPKLLSEKVVLAPCNNDYIQTITRVYTAQDSKGNYAPECTIVFRLLRIDTLDITCPVNYSIEDDNALSCDGKWKSDQLCQKSDLSAVLDTDSDGDGILDADLFWDDNHNGYPDPEEVGVPTILSNINGDVVSINLYPFPDVYCNSAVTYKDIKLPKFDCTTLIMRTWTLREWHCNGELTFNCTQMLEIRDETPPTITCPEKMEITTNTIMGSTSSSYGNVTCGSSVALPLPDGYDNCAAKINYRVTYSGGFQANYNGISPVVLPMGISQVKYVASDDCYNTSECVMQVEIIDNTPPVAVCDQYTAVSLTTGGSAVVKALSFDDGSYDDCKKHCMLVRRMTPDPINCECRVPEICDMKYIGNNNGSYYYISNYNISANIAKKRAAAYGGSVVVFEQAAEEAWLLSKVRQNYSGNFWIGMKRFSNGFLWDNHEGLSYANWMSGRPISSQTSTNLGLYPTTGNTVLFADGATTSNADSNVSDLKVVQGPGPAVLDISWKWYVDDNDMTEENGVNLKLLHHDGYEWKTIHTQRYSGNKTTNTIAPFLGNTQNGYFRFAIPQDAACGKNYFRISIESNAFTSDIIVDNFASSDCGSDYDNADVAFDVASGDCVGDCVKMNSANYWYDTSCDENIPYILELKDICGFSETVNFCCSDVGTDQMVVFRVIDIFGNYNDCMVSIDVQDKLAPTIICPPNEVVDCDIVFNPSNLTPLFGYPTLSDDCGASIDEVGINELSSCNLGTYTRVFTATDNGGRTSTCKQIITFENSDPFIGGLDVVCPRDTTLIINSVTGCMVAEDFGPDVMGYPSFANQRCGLIGTNYDDEVFTFNGTNGNACFKILRTWEVIDWCQSSLPVWSCVQVIKATNNVKPVITGCSSTPFEICTFDAECQSGNVEFTVSATDDCTDEEDLRWRYSVHSGALGVGPLSYNYPVYENTGSGNTATLSGEFPIGSHVVRWTFFDRCGNTTTCDQPFTIANCKAPSTYCISGLAVDLMPMDFDGNGIPDFGMVELWASDFNVGTSHACDYPVFLSFSPDTSERMKTFDCTTRGDQDVQIWATVVGFNGELYQSFCSSIVNVQDNNNACQGQRDETVNVDGNIYTEKLENLGDVNVSLDGSPLTKLTNVNGEYAFPDMPMGGAYIINPSSNKKPLNGVSTLDLVEIQRHILGLQQLDSPYKIIAADVNKDNKLTSVDLLELRKLILGIYNELPHNDSWRFVDKNYKFTDPTYPLIENFTEDYLINKLEEDMKIDFIAVKVGDVNGSALAAINSGNVVSRNRNIATLNMEEKSFEIGERINIPITMNDLATNGFQFALHFDSDVLEMESLSSQNNSFGKANYVINDNEVVVSWHDQNGELQKGELLALNAIAKKNGKLSEVLSISSELLSAEVYQEGGIINTPVLDFGIVNESKFQLFQNSPNPFTDLTEVSFILEDTEDVEISINDIQGRTVKTIWRQYHIGLNKIELNSSDLGNTGVFYLTLKTKNNIATLKMVAIK